MRGCLIVLLFLLSGCDLLTRWRGANADVRFVVLHPGAFDLNSEGRVFPNAGGLKSLGSVNVCVVVRSKYPLSPSPQLEADFEALLHGTNLSATLTDVDGNTYQVGGAALAWELRGVITGAEELAACTSSVSAPELPEGKQLKSVLIKSDQTLQVLGAYLKTMPSIAPGLRTTVSSRKMS